MVCVRCGEELDYDQNGYDICKECEDELLIDQLSIFRDRLGYTDISFKE